MSIAQAISAVEDKGIDTDLELYEVIENSPGESVYSLAKLMTWSNGKTYASVRRLEKSKLVHIEKMEKDGRSVLVVRPYDWYEFFTPEELQEMSRPEFMDEVETIIKAKE
ncbi:MAG: MarR family transcriptional regulator [Methanothrix sp.]|jgi:predicted transcriptional regulator|nr:MarR family transcriptional regulator [Methanothrix sp.]